MPELNEPQARAVAHAEGPLLVFAGAGSGKTRVITYRVANLLAEHRVPPYRILAVTFTNKAAGEMRQRLVSLAGPEVVQDLWVGTFHSICARLLRRYHDEVGLRREYVIYDDSDQRAVIGRVIKEMGVDDRRYPPKRVLARIHRQKREGIRPDDVRVTHTFDDTHVEVFRKYERALAVANAVDFEDLIVHIMRIAENPWSSAGEELRTRFLHVLVDEFQDTNASQYRLVRALAARERNLCVVGDDDQSIYRWRGADVRNIRGFRHDFPGATVIKLEQNYRSTANIVAAALGVIEPAHTREPKELWTEAERGAPVRVQAVRDEREEAAFVARTIRAETSAGVDPSEIAVFYRVHAQSRVLEEALRSENIPYQIVGGMKFFDRAEVKDCLAYLRLLDNPRSDADLLRIINVPSRGVGKKTVQRLQEIAASRDVCLSEAIDSAVEAGGLGAAAKRKLASFRGLLRGLRDDSERLTPAELAGRVLEVTGYRQHLRNDDTAESDARLENLEELVGSIAEYEADAHEAGEAASLAEYLQRVSLIADVDTMKDVSAVSLMTVHSAKGLEFTSVLLTGMEEEIFPYQRLDSAELEELDEERRLAYVAVTRAKKRLFISHARVRLLFGRTRYQEPSRFLSDLPERSVQHDGNGRPPSTSREPSGGWHHAGERHVDRDAFDDLPPDEEGIVVRPGDRVVHRRFGEGIVERVDVGASATVVARFPGFGTRKILAEYLQLGQ